MTPSGPSSPRRCSTPTAVKQQQSPAWQAEAAPWFQVARLATSAHLRPGRGLGQLRTELRDEANDIRRKLDMPVIKPRVRVPAGKGATW